jgi:hypothetical protein
LVIRVVSIVEAFLLYVFNSHRTNSRPKDNSAVTMPVIKMPSTCKFPIIIATAALASRPSQLHQTKPSHSLSHRLVTSSRFPFYDLDVPLREPLRLLVVLSCNF